MDANSSARLFPKIGISANVVAMTMGVHDQIHLSTHPLHQTEDRGTIAPGINNNSLATILIQHNITIDRERPNR